MTVLLGIGGALVGGFLYSVVRGASVQPFSLASHNWYGWIVAILGAMLVVWFYPYAFPRRWWNWLAPMVDDCAIDVQFVAALMRAI